MLKGIIPKAVTFQKRQGKNKETISLKYGNRIFKHKKEYQCGWSRVRGGMDEEHVTAK